MQAVNWRSLSQVQILAPPQTQAFPHCRQKKRTSIQKKIYSRPWRKLKFKLHNQSSSKEQPNFALAGWLYTSTTTNISPPGEEPSKTSSFTAKTSTNLRGFVLQNYRPSFASVWGQNCTAFLDLWTAGSSLRKCRSCDKKQATVSIPSPYCISSGRGDIWFRIEQKAFDGRNSWDSSWFTCRGTRSRQAKDEGVVISVSNGHKKTHDTKTYRA